MIYDKYQIRESLSTEDIFQLLVEFGGEPEYTNSGIVSKTICHNDPTRDQCSHKLYYYYDSTLFHCFTDCGDSFDIFDLVIKVFRNQKNKEITLDEAVRYIAYRFGISGIEFEDNGLNTIDWKIFNEYDKIKEIEIKDYSVQLKKYDDKILDYFNYSAKITPWLNEGISQGVIESARIGFFPGGDQITIPHYDKDWRLVGIRGRTLCKEDAERYGKYRPLIVNKQLYNHSIGMNLYNINFSFGNIKQMKTAFIFESEKATLLYASYFGRENDISVACCGSSISAYQIQILKEAGAKEIVIALDRQFQELGDKEFKKLTKNLERVNQRYGKDFLISFIFDKNMITDYKDSPIDKGPDIFLKLYKERIIL